MLNSNVDLEYYEELYGDEPMEEKMPRGRGKMKLENKRNNDKRNQIDKKNAVKAPWKDDSVIGNTQED